MDRKYLSFSLLSEFVGAGLVAFPSAITILSGYE